MTASHDLDHVLERYLQGGPTELPERSFDEVRTSIDHIQQRVVIGPWRFPNMPIVARLAAVGVVVFVLSIAGFQLSPRQGGVGTVSPTPSSEPSRSPSATASPAALPGQYDANYTPVSLVAGDYSFTNPDLTNAQRLTVSVPEGWSTSQGFLSKHAGEPGYVMLVPWVVSHVYTDGCHWSTLVSAGSTVDDLVNVLVAQSGRTATTAPVDVTVAGHPGKQVVLTQPVIDVATCTSGILRYWPDAGPDFTGGLCCDPAGNVDVIDVIDVAGHRMVLVARHYAGSSDADKAELQGIIDSIQIVPLPATASPLPVGSTEATDAPAPSPAS